MKIRSSFLTLIAFTLGSLLAFFPVPWMHEISVVITENFIRILKLLSLPLIFLSLSSTLINLDGFDDVKRLFRRVFTYTVLTTLIAASVALLLLIAIKPAAGATIIHTPLAQYDASSYTFSYLLNVIPENPIRPFLDNNVLGVAFIALLLGFAIQKAPGKKCQTLGTLFKELLSACLTIAMWVIKLLPLAIFGFTYLFVEEMRANGQNIHSLILYATCVIGANIIQGLVVLPLLLRSKGISWTQLGRHMLPALSTAFFSKSSSATLPLALECAKKANISSKTASFAFPMCSVINMNGCAAFILITTLYVMMRSGIALTPMEMIPWIFFSTLAAIGNAGVPMGCFFLTSAFLVGMNVPLDVMGLILPLYSLFDMVETALNVWSDSCVAKIVDVKEQEALIPSTQENSVSTL